MSPTVGRKAVDSKGMEGHPYYRERENLDSSSRGPEFDGEQRAGLILVWIRLFEIEKEGGRDQKII
jgi:hypothetical protein